LTLFLTTFKDVGEGVMEILRSFIVDC